MRQSKIIVLISSLLALSIFLIACGDKKITSTDEGKLKVVVTNSILWDITKNIAKDKIELHSIVPVGKDPHDYEVLPEDIKKSTDADVIFYNGLNLETGGDAWFTKLMNNASKKEGKDYFAVSEGVEPLYLEGKNVAGKEDPHAWLNLENGIIYARNIAEQLIIQDPENKAEYEKNLKKYIEKLASLDKKAKQQLATIPSSQKMIVTSEGCFKYFSKAYDIPSSYIWEINTEEEGTPDQIKNLVNQLRKTSIPALFVESSVDERPMKMISKETQIPIHAKIFTDSIAEQGQTGDSYYAMMEWNFTQIYNGLSRK